jgi:hypothetical protein
LYDADTGFVSRNQSCSYFPSRDTGEAGMTERLYLDHPDVYMLAECDARNGGKAVLVVCEHPAGAEYARQLAASLSLPLRYFTGEEQESPAAVPAPRRDKGAAGAGGNR